MKDTSGSIMIILLVSIVAFGIGSIGGALHIGEDISQAILPTSIIDSGNIMKPIHDNQFEPNNISITSGSNAINITPTTVTISNSTGSTTNTNSGTTSISNTSKNSTASTTSAKTNSSSGSSSSGTSTTNGSSSSGTSTTNGSSSSSDSGDVVTPKTTADTGTGVTTNG